MHNPWSKSARLAGHSKLLWLCRLHQLASCTYTHTWLQLPASSTLSVSAHVMTLAASPGLTSRRPQCQGSPAGSPALACHGTAWCALEGAPALLSAQGRSSSAPIYTYHVRSCVARVCMSSSVKMRSQPVATQGLEQAPSHVIAGTTLLCRLPGASSRQAAPPSASS